MGYQVTHTRMRLSIAASCIALASVLVLFGAVASRSTSHRLALAPTGVQRMQTRVSPMVRRMPVVGGTRRVIARNEGLEQIPEPEKPDAMTGFTNKDSAGQSNIFGRETKAYVGESVSGNGLMTGGYILAAAAAVSPWFLLLGFLL
uniref:Uncharacterized protein n=1 Tax=Lotharella globosa TaxID=91324 RepID=A0A7S3ZFI0_9EUKA